MGELHIVEEWRRVHDVMLPFLIRCGAAALCGAVVGIERELRDKPAGFRTNILICVGAAMYMAAGQLLSLDTGQFTDQARIAAQVVTGIGFLGAGCIIQSAGKVKGLTTAATIWVVAAVGLIAGAGFPILAFISACMVVTTLAVLGKFERRYLERNASDEADEDAGRGPWRG
jgi:putative Mg2+ transporter-C (MgtC) family protein